MDRKLLTGAIALLFIEVFILLADLNLLPIEWNLYSGVNEGKAPIGEVIYTKQNVKRRSQNSILWESSETTDKLYNYDSVLTLSKSAAQLNLKGNIKIQLHENTLVVLEPMNNEQTEEFRLKFTKGNIRSQSAEKSFQLGSQNWTINANQNSDLSIRSLDENNIEIEVNEGGVDLQNKDNKSLVKSFNKGNKIILDKNEVGSVKKITDDISWSDKLDRRIYAHQFPVNIPLAWIGSAQNLRQVTPHKTLENHSLNPGEQSKLLQLMPGSYYLSLESEGSVSKTLNLHVWPAPKIKYFSPLPRDRVKTLSQKTFSWSPIELASQYRLEIASTLSFDFIEQVETPTIQLVKTQLNTEGPKFWRVFAIDEEGFEIPPYYSNELFSLKDPLAAPVLKAPVKRRPASPKKKKKRKPFSFLDKVYSLVFQKSYAEKSRLKHHPPTTNKIPTTLPKKIEEKPQPPEAITKEKAQAPPALPEIIYPLKFSWYPVPDADHYTIEISSHPEFFKPEVMTTVTKEEFIWDKYEKKIYYWRVAAGQKNGRMGLFSEAAKADLSKITNVSLAKLSPGIELIKPKQKVKKAEAKPPPPENIEETTPSKKALSRKKSFQLWLAGSYHFFNYDKSNDFKASLSGFAPISTGGKVVAPINEDSNLNLNWHYFNIGWKSESPETTPFQEELSDWQLSSSLLYSKENDELAYGLSIQRLSLLERNGLENLKISNVWVYGLTCDYQFTYFKSLKSNHQISLNYGSSIWNPALFNSVTYSVKQWGTTKAFIGGHFNINLIYGKKSASGLYGTTGFRTGIEW